MHPRTTPYLPAARRALAGLCALVVVAAFAFAPRQAPAQGLAPRLMRLPLDMSREQVPDVAWYGLYMMGMKVGHARTACEASADPAAPGYVVTVEMDIAFKAMGREAQVRTRDVRRFGPASPYPLVAASYEDSQGNSVELTQADGLFTAAIVSSGRTMTRNMGRLDVTLADATTSTAWLRGKPRVGDAISARSFDLASLTVGEEQYRLAAANQTLAEGVNATIYTLDFTQSPSGLNGLATADGQGRLLTMTLGANLEMRLEPEAVAKRTEVAGDVFVQSMAALDKPLGEPKRLKQVTLMAGGDAVGLLRDGPNQRVRVEPVGLTSLVLGDRNDKAAVAAPEEQKKALEDTPRYPAADPRVKALAERAVTGARTPRAKAEALAGFVSEYIGDDLRPEPLTVFQIMDDRRGDCTEHALLFVTLARALGIPAREALGLYYLGDGMRAFGGHAWVMVALDGRWVEMDPTLNLTRTTPGHILIGSGQTALADQLTAARRLSFKLADVKR